MPTRTAKITTPRASIYLQQLCKHFAHKVPATFSETEGRLELPFGLCHLGAEGETLTLAVEGTASELARLEKVIDDHLARFAFRENPAITWREHA